MTHARSLMIASSAIIVLLCACASQPKHFTSAPADPVSARLPPHVSEHLPLSFESNLGQAGPEVHFLMRSGRFALLLTSNGMLLALSGPASDSAEREGPNRAVVGILLMDANPSPAISGIRRLPGRSHYFAGVDSAKWRTDIPTYASVAYRHVYPNVDLFFYGNGQQWEYDFVLAPGADLDDIVLGIEGADRARLDSNGNLVLETVAGEIIQRAPVCYQEIAGVRRPVSGRCAFRLEDSHRKRPFADRTRQYVAFEVSGYDASRPLVVDPVVAYSTYLGGSGSDGAHGATVDAAGNVYVTGETSSIDFTTTPGVLQPAINGSSDVFVTKLNSSGAVLYSTYIGGALADRGIGIGVDTAGNAYVTGRTASTNFPTTPGAFRRFFGGDIYDAFVAKLNPDGSALLYSTFLGGGGNDAGFAVAVDAAGSTLTTGGTASTDFPVTAGAFQPFYGGGLPGNDAFVTKLNGDGSELQYSTYLGGSFVDRANAIALDSNGNAYVTGWTESTDFPTVRPQQPEKAASRDAFVTSLRPDGSVVFSTFLGGGADDAGLAIAVDAAGGSYVTGYTESLDFPTRNAYQAAIGGGRDAFVSKLEAGGSGLVYSTYFGGGDSENLVGIAAVVGAIAVDSTGRAHVTGSTRSDNFPTVNPTQPARGGGLDDAFVAKFDAEGRTVVFSTFLGGSLSDVGTGITVHSSGDTVITGQTSSTDFPAANAVQPTSGGGADSFVTRIVDAATAGADLAVTQTASPDPVMPGADIMYVIELTSSGPDDATSATLTDAVPTGTTFQSLSPSMDWTCSAPAVGETGTIECANPSVVPGSAHSFTLIVRADAALGEGAVINNTATVAASTPDPVSGNNSATVTTTVSSGDSSADLSVTMTDAPDPVSPSSSITYTIEVSNPGPGPAMSASLSGEVPADSTFFSLSGSPDWSCTAPAVGEAGLVSCTIGSLASGATEILMLVVRVDDSVGEGALINNTVSVSSSTSDPDAHNNSATVATTISSSEPTETLAPMMMKKIAIPSRTATSLRSFDTGKTRLR